MKRMAVDRMLKSVGARRGYSFNGPLEEGPKIVWINDYAITLRNGKLNCTCPHFQIRLRRTNELCKHAKQAVSEGHFKK